MTLLSVSLKKIKSHLKELSILTSKACKDYAATTNKLATHITALWTDLEFKNLRITELEGSRSQEDDRTDSRMVPQ